MIIITTAGAFEVTSCFKTSLNRVVVTAREPETIKQLLTNIELMGVSEDNPESKKISEMAFSPRKGTWSIEIDRATFLLGLAMEINHYLAYGPGEFPYPAVSEPGYTEQINNVKDELGLV